MMVELGVLVKGYKDPAKGTLLETHGCGCNRWEAGRGFCHEHWTGGYFAGLEDAEHKRTDLRVTRVGGL
ncbi:MAG: hypothetical protein HYS81_01600 [Candidatus Aenigmatarchaeota archaeon]|nr:MAG: hypothetical protein HYS81_01600 [Candidatus Aenigmarchaeota archaeon]